MSRPTSSVPRMWLLSRPGGVQALGDVLLVRAERRQALGEDRGEQDHPERGRREPEDGVAPHQAASERMRGSSAA